MQNLWLKIKIWTKIGLFSIVVIYLLMFVFKNSDQQLSIWFWFGHVIETSMLVLIPVVLLAGVVGTFVVSMAFRALRQIQELRGLTATAQLHTDVADLKAKSVAVQTPTTTTDSIPPAV